MTRRLCVLAWLLSAGLAGCNGAVGSGTPPAPGGVGAPAQRNPAANVSDDQAAGDVADYYLQRMSYAAPDQRVQSRIVALNAYARRAGGVSPAASPAVGGSASSDGADSAGVPATAAPLPAAVPAFTPQALEPPAFPSDDGPAKKLAEQAGVTLVHRVADPKTPAQPPVDRIDITRGSVAWHIDLLTGLIGFQKEHTAGVIENGAERAREVAVSFLQHHGGIPEDAVEVNPVYQMTQGDTAAAPKPTSITFVWRHNDPSIIGADAIAVTVTPGTQGFNATPAPNAALEVTAYTRLWRAAGKPLAADKTPPMTAAQALAQLARGAALPASAKVTAVVFGGLRAAPSEAPLRTRPAWAFQVGDAWYAVDAIGGAVSGSTALGVPSDAIAMAAKAKPAAATR
ncbi:MAG: hypothetical protein KGM44_02130 [bacterium]|nr:hypothetical protein [bacterium]